MIKIALTCSMEDSRFFLKSRYIDYLLMGAEYCGINILPVILPHTSDPESVKQSVLEFDGFIFTGGGDIEPKRYGEDKNIFSYDIDPVRDSNELILIDEVKRLGKPALGICRGIQIMAVSCGGRIIQDIDNSAHSIENAHGMPVHKVKLSGMARDVFDSEEIMTNSYHHQAVGYAGNGVTVEGITPDGVIEMISFDGGFFRAVQWHPEINPDANSMKLISSFLNNFA